MTDPGRRIGAVSKTIDIIDRLSRYEDARVTELADDVGFPASTVHNHLSTLVEADLVVKNGDFYHLAGRFLSYGHAVQYRKELYERVEPYLDQLVEETEFRIIFMIEENGYGVFLHMRSGKYTNWEHYTEGEREYLHVLAAGKAMAELPRDRVEEILDEHGLPSETESSITSRDDLFAELEQIRSEEVAYNRSENIQNVVAIGAPITDSKNGRVLGSISISGATHSIPEDQLDGELKNSLLGAINQLELELSLA